MKVHKGYKFRIYPDKEQEIFFSKSFGCNRFVWNYFLNKRKDDYLKKKDLLKDNKTKSKKDKIRTLNYYDNAKELTLLKSSEETKWLSEVNSQSLQQSLRSLEVAYNKFFLKQTLLPKFKSKNDHQSFCVPQGFKLEGKLLHLPKINPVKIVCHREFGENAKILSVVISKSKSGRYFASLCVEEDAKSYPKAEGEVGIDLGLTNLMTFSDGKFVKNPKIAWKNRKKIAYLQRQHSKKRKEKDGAGKNREKVRIKLARCHDKIVRIKQDFTHKLTSKITDENQVIVMEDLSVTGMMKNRRLARSIGEVSWGELVRQIKYKSEWKGRKFLQIDRFFPSSKLCACGFVHQGLKLSDRKWHCPKCNLELDRDVNAARNILKQGRNLSGEGLPSESKQKIREAFRKDNRKVKCSRVNELRSLGIYSGE